MRWRDRSLILVLVALLVASSAVLAGMAFERGQEREARARMLTGGDPGRAPALLIRYGCAGCHEVPGLRGPAGRVGPPLTGVQDRVYIAGMLTNTPDNLVRWIVNPKDVNPRTAMPVTGVSGEEARHIAAYLLAQR